MRFNLGGFSRKGEFDRIDVQTDVPVVDATAIATGSVFQDLVLNSIDSSPVVVSPSIDALWFGVTVADATVTLPAVMYYQMLDYTILLETDVHATGEKYLDWVLNTITPTTIRAVPGSPIVIPYVSTTQLKSQSASRKMIDKMARAQFEFAGAITNPATYFHYVEMVIPDYLGNDQKVFVGFIPSSSATFEAADSSISYTAYDYSWYLTMQYLDNSHKVLLTPVDQMSNLRYKLNYVNPVVYWEVGQFICGQTGHCTGKILSINLSGTPSSGSHYIEIDCITGNKAGGYYFSDGEVLEVNGVVNATAYGHDVDITGTVDPLLPDEYVSELLGGADYEKVTGIYPYRIIPISSGWSATSDPVAVQFAFDEKTTKIQAIERLSKYIRYIFMVKTLVVGGITYTAAYFIPEGNIDLAAPDGLDLPAKVSITKPSEFLASPLTCESKGEERYNYIRVRCQSLSGDAWYESLYKSDGLLAGDELPIEYYEINQDIASQTECDNRLDDLKNYYSDQIITYTGTFLERSDFRLLQQLEFSGYDEITSGTYRIIGINYEKADGGTSNQVTCTIISDSQFKFWLNLNRVFTDSITEIQNIVKGELDKLKPSEYGTVITVDESAGTALTQLESGHVERIRVVR